MENFKKYIDFLFDKIDNRQILGNHIIDNFRSIS